MFLATLAQRVDWPPLPIMGRLQQACEPLLTMFARTLLAYGDSAFVEAKTSPPPVQECASMIEHRSGNDSEAQIRKLNSDAVVFDAVSGIGEKEEAVHWPSGSGC